MFTTPLKSGQTAATPRSAVGPGAVLLVIAVLATAGTLAALVAHRNNAGRLAAFRADPACQPANLSGAQGATVTSCTVAAATIASRWIHSYKGSHYYRLAIATPAAGTDSVELKGSTARTVWEMTAPGSSVSATIFRESPMARRRVTRVATRSLAAMTAWDPERRNTDSEVGIWFLGSIALASILTLLGMRIRRPPETW